MPDLTECAACGRPFDEGLFAAGAAACNGCGSEFCPGCAADTAVGDDCPRCRTAVAGGSTAGRQNPQD